MSNKSARGLTLAGTPRIRKPKTYFGLTVGNKIVRFNTIEDRREAFESGKIAREITQLQAREIGGVNYQAPVIELKPGAKQDRLIASLERQLKDMLRMIRELRR